MALTDQPMVPPVNPLGHFTKNNQSGKIEAEKNHPSNIENKPLPVDIPEMKNLTIKRNNKRKLKPDYESHDVGSEQSDFNPDSNPSDTEIQI